MTLWTTVEDVWVSLLFQGRSWLRWSRPGFVEAAEDKVPLGALHSESALLESRLRVTYPRIHHAFQHAGLLRYRENLNLLCALDQMTQTAQMAPPPGTETSAVPRRVLEVGAKNWSTVDALVAFLSVFFTERFELLGMEVDPWPIYRDGHSRWDYAQAFCAPYPEATYDAGDVMALSGRFDLILISLPFVFEAPLRAWGLPRRFFQPERLFAHLGHTLLAAGGHLVILNQGEDEFRQQETLLRDFPGTVQFSGEVSQPFLAWRYPRYGWWLQGNLATKELSSDGILPTMAAR